ncbi:MAG: MoaD/ThiS family protein [Cyclobacteriaceae bacterium]
MKIILFGIAKDIVGAPSILLPNGHGLKTVVDLKSWIIAKYPRMSHLNSMAIAVDHEYAENDLPLSEDQEIAIIPPISGG